MAEGNTEQQVVSFTAVDYSYDDLDAVIDSLDYYSRVSSENEYFDSYEVEVESASDNTTAPLLPILLSSVNNSTNTNIIAGRNSNHSVKTLNSQNQKIMVEYYEIDLLRINDEIIKKKEKHYTERLKILSPTMNNDNFVAYSMNISPIKTNILVDRKKAIEKEIQQKNLSLTNIDVLTNIESLIVVSDNAKGDIYGQFWIRKNCCAYEKIILRTTNYMLGIYENNCENAVERIENPTEKGFFDPINDSRYYRLKKGTLFKNMRLFVYNTIFSQFLCIRDLFTKKESVEITDIYKLDIFVTRSGTFKLVLANDYLDKTVWLTDLEFAVMTNDETIIIKANAPKKFINMINVIQNKIH